MSPLPGFDAESDLAPQAARLAPKLKRLADQGVFMGTSSWKYEGWLGSVYGPGRYATRGKFSKKKFETECLAEYGRVFPTVCGDFAFYQFPSPDYWRRLFEDSLSTLTVGLKVPEEITVPVWPRHARYGERSGRPNPHFLDVGLFTAAFLRRLEPYAERVGPVILEFGTFAKSTFPDGDAFLTALDPFLAALPGGFRYAVEVRNPEYLGPGYFHVLSSHNVAHVLSAWTRMPELGAQLDMEGAETADFAVVRALLNKGRGYEKAVQTFEPYRLVQEPNHGARDAMRRVAERSLERKRPAFVYVNNRLEGNAPTTIEGIADMLL